MSAGRAIRLANPGFRWFCALCSALVLVVVPSCGDAAAASDSMPELLKSSARADAGNWLAPAQRQLDKQITEYTCCSAPEALRRRWRTQSCRRSGARFAGRHFGATAGNPLWYPEFRRRATWLCKERRPAAANCREIVRSRRRSRSSCVQGCDDARYPNCERFHIAANCR